MAWRLRRFRAHDGLTRWVARTDLPLALISVPLLLLLLLPLIDEHPAGWVSHAEDLLDIVISVTFGVDYAARLYLAPQRWLFVRTHLLDLALVLLPFLRVLRVVRAIRLLRLIRVARIGAMAGVLDRRAKSALHVRVPLYAAGVVTLAICVASSEMYDVEHSAPGANITSIGAAFWWSAETVSTVGYGDRFPVTVAGRLIAVGLMLVGLGLLGVITASTAAWFVDRLSDVRASELQAQSTLDTLLAEVRELRALVDARQPSEAAPES